MIELSQQQLDRVARWLDGSDPQLTNDELAVAGEIRRGDARLVKALDVPVGPHVMARLRREITQQVSRPRRSLLRLGLLTAAAAAALLLAIVSIFYTLNPGADSGIVGLAVSAVESTRSADEDRAIAAEIEKATASRVASELDDLNRQMNDDQPAETPSDESGEGDAG